MTGFEPLAGVSLTCWPAPFGTWFHLGAIMVSLVNHILNLNGKPGDAVSKPFLLRVHNVVPVTICN